MVQAVLFFIIALLYATVGFGGGSGYIAILSFYDSDPAQLRFIALCCNIVVVSGGTYHFVKNKILSISKVWPFAITSIPMAFLGGTIQLKSNVFFITLAFALFFAGVLMVSIKNDQNPLVKSSNKFSNAVIGGAIGFLSGLVGIGGGIFLAPILHLMRWDKPKVIAATASFFILVNSIFGLLGQMVSTSPSIDYKQLLLFIVAVLVGGQIGSRITVSWISQSKVRALTAALVIFASLRLIYKVLIA